MFRDLLVHVDGSQAGRRRVQFAVALAQRMGSHLSGLHVTPPAEVPPLYKPSQVEQVASELTRELVLDAAAAASIFHEETAQRLPDANWFEADGAIVQGISDRARYVDLVILGQYEWQGPPEAHPLPVAHSVVLRCGRPVLVVPAAWQYTALARVAIAWDGSREAVRAVHDALPLLHLALSVKIVTIIQPSAADDDRDANVLLTHLNNHGIAIDPNILQIRSVPEHASLQKQFEHDNYDLLVMGGYSHPRWLEFLFGGATQSILLSSKIPVLVSH
jgi:nucleotide-binding universal stress UspA family protein